MSSRVQVRTRKGKRHVPGSCQAQRLRTSHETLTQVRIPGQKLPLQESPLRWLLLSRLRWGFVSPFLVFVNSRTFLRLSPVFLNCVNSPQWTGFQSYATDVLSWIKQEEEPRCPERQDLAKEEISIDSSTGQ